MRGWRGEGRGPGDPRRMRFAGRFAQTDSAGPGRGARKGGGAQPGTPTPRESPQRGRKAPWTREAELAEPADGA